MPKNNDDKMKQISDMLIQGVHDLFNSEKYKVYLNVMGKFTEYSINNMILIASQRPDSTLVAGYRAWEQKFGRHVKRGEHGIRIIAPCEVKEKVQQVKKDEQGNIVFTDDGKPQMEEVVKSIPRFRAVTVFDISQTEGDPLPERPGVKALTSEVEDFDSIMKAIENISPVPVRFDAVDGTANGYYDATGKEIVIRKGMSESQTVKTAVHEVVHAFLHDPDKLREQGTGRVDQTTREVEAESTAFLVCTYFGIDASSYTFPYVTAWSSSVQMPELRASMEKIRDTATDIVDRISSQLTPERDVDQIKQSEIMKDEMPEIHYSIYQINESENVPYLFMSSDFFKKHNMAPKANDYNLVYDSTLTGVSKSDALDEIYYILNADERPDGFRGHSLSVSDVIVVNGNGEPQAWYVDKIGFAPLKDFEQEYHRAEQEKNEACKAAIEKGIASHFNGTRLDHNAPDAIVEKFGFARVEQVLAITVHQKEFDGRFSPDTRTWADEVLKNEDIDKSKDAWTRLEISSHPAVLDGFIGLVRQRHKEQERDANKESSIEKLHRMQEVARDQNSDFPNQERPDREELSL